MWLYFKRCFVVVPRFAGFVSPLIVLLLYVLISFGKVLLWCFASFAPAFRFTSLCSVFASIGFIIKVSASIANLIFISFTSVLDTIIIYQL